MSGMDAWQDPRPHVGEPLALDLLNTEWVQDGEPVDLLHDLAGTATWLATNGIAARPTAAVRGHLVDARAAILGVLTDGSDRRARRRLNDVLAHGRLRLSLGDDGAPARTVDVDDPAWFPAVLAGLDLLDLLRQRPDRVRRCDHPDCVLWFLDTSRNGTRRWHSMATCGNRAKAKRHYSRTRAPEG